MSTPGEPAEPTGLVVPAAADPVASEPSAADPAAARAPRRTDTKSPHRSRARALKILFQADVRGVSPDVTLARLDDEPAAREILDAIDDLSSGGELLPPVIEGATEVELVSSDQGETASAGASAEAHGSADGGSTLDDFTRSLVAGVHQDRVRVDGLIARFARKWQISRMPVVDRTVLRLATYELIHEDTSPAIVIDEAVGLAKAMSTDDSGRYVNGVLESIRRELATNPLPREVPDEASAEAEELLDLATAPITPASEVASTPSEAETTPPDPDPDAADVASSHSEVEVTPPDLDPDAADVQDASAEAATGDDEVSVPAPDPAEPRDTPQGSDQLSRVHPHNDQPPADDGHPALDDEDDPSPAIEAPSPPVSHGQPSLFEDSLGR